MIEIQNISKHYGKTKALDNISFKIHKGEFVCIVGSSGAGKTTLVRLLIDEEKPTSGKIYIGGRDIHGLRKKEIPYYRRKVGVVFQDFKLLPQKNVYENVAYALEVSGASNKEIKIKVPRILELTGLKERAQNYPDELSGGEKQRTTMARALVHRPKILIADEPTGNLDPVTAWEIVGLLRKINRVGTTVILATHNKDIVNALRTRVVVLKKGKLASDQSKGRYII